MALAKSGEGAKQPFVPTEAWLEAFTCQMSEPTFYDRMWRYAKRRGQLVAFVRDVDPDAYGTELVQDIIDDTLEGRIRWDPHRVDLRKHVRDAIKSRSRHHYCRALRQKHIPLDDRRGKRLLDEQVAAAHRESPLEKAERVEAATEIIETIGTHFESDVEVRRLLAAYEQGLTSRAEILEVAGLTKLQYDAARKRLDRWLAELPQQLTLRSK